MSVEARHSADIEREDFLPRRNVLPYKNRVNQFGELIATEAPGYVIGNRVYLRYQQWRIRRSLAHQEKDRLSSKVWWLFAVAASLLLAACATQPGVVPPFSTNRDAAVAHYEAL